MLSTVSAAFFKTTLYDDVGKTFKPELDQRRNNIVDLNVSFKENELTFEDIAHFLTAFRKALDDTSIF